MRLFQGSLAIAIVLGSGLAGCGGASKSGPQVSSQEAGSATVRSLPLKDLGPLPGNESSQYLTTIFSGVQFTWPDVKGSFTLDLEAKPELPAGAYLEAAFENPARPGESVLVRQVWKGNDRDIMMKSPVLTGFKCWNYRAAISIYSDESKQTLLGQHTQIIQSTINSDKLKQSAKSKEDFIKAMERGDCP